jgi:hypothetical protein
MRNIELECDIFFDIAITEYDKLSHFTFENLSVAAKNGNYDKNLVKDISFTNVNVNGTQVE